MANQRRLKASASLSVGWRSGVDGVGQEESPLDNWHGREGFACGMAAASYFSKKGCSSHWGG